MQNERRNFDAARRAHPTPCYAAVLGGYTYDVLKAEVLACVADFFPCDRSTLSTELDKLKIPHFHYNGVLILRANNCNTLGIVFL